MIHYKTWMKQFENKPMPIGDLANDIATDGANSPRSNKYDDIYYHLSFTNHACHAALRAFEETWYDYQREQLAIKRLKWLKKHGIRKMISPLIMER